MDIAFSLSVAFIKNVLLFMVIYFDEVWFIVSGYVDNIRKPNDVVYIVHSLERLRHEPFQTGMDLITLR